MTDSSDAPRRLIYGPADFRGYDGVVIDADTGARWAAATAARTWGEFVSTMCGEDWEGFAARNELEHEGMDAADPFNFEEWVSETWDAAPESVAYDLAARRIAELKAEHPSGLSGVEQGGGSPGGNIDVISGPLDQLELLASLIAAHDGFTLERDDAAVEAGMLRSIWR
ncbi:hypothetical protein [Microbacterium sp. CFBP9034]|uniref:hypothetical protein n=1 Tax=Microbacterium sp. CFBP9034 TaxID=3096540 RepID=UPI002A6A4891|nr:hypothetical protein [Microbacterium sp. CFBP9034]MDY0910089.1 hypothetical protein [Microbacterium sp. CFBP9034]